METEVAIIGAGPAGAQAAIDLGLAGIDTVLIDPSPGLPEAPDGIVTIPRRSSIFGEGPCGQPAGTSDWLEKSEAPIHDMLMAGRKIVGKMHWNEILGYNFTRKIFWGVMLDAARQSGANVLEASVTAAQRDDDGITLQTTSDDVQAKAVIYAAGVRGSNVESIPRQLGLGVPPMVHGIFGDFIYDGDPWQSPDLGFLFNLEIVKGYFWCAYARKSNRVSIGIMDEDRAANHDLIYRFANTGIIPELKDRVPQDLTIQEGRLGAVSHLKDAWPVARTAPRVISVGEATGQIGTYVYEGLFNARYEGRVAAKVLAGIKQDDVWANTSRYKQYEKDVKILDDYFLRMARMQHYAMYHGGTNGQIALEAYLKAFNEHDKIVVDSMKTQYLEFSNMRRFEIGLFGAILGHVPFLDKLSVTASLVTARMQK
ncbi:MAG TPA: FAD-dependent monooxygenase [Candidatus Lokiarchaeia archaeon]|nr:FAD-dependent monooxygenase [Candidatus Lokiarchaeia archaeon]